MQRTLSCGYLYEHTYVHVCESIFIFIERDLLAAIKPYTSSHSQSIRKIHYSISIYDEYFIQSKCFFFSFIDRNSKVILESKWYDGVEREMERERDDEHIREQIKTYQIHIRKMFYRCFAFILRSNIGRVKRVQRHSSSLYNCQINSNLCCCNTSFSYQQDIK